MTALGHDHNRIPDWQVQTVFDPDGGGFDFAYTIGLHERGLPELHMWARPPIGDDPGEDWMFSDRDRCQILNDAAFRLIDGAVAIGSRWEEQYDDGLVTARFQLDPPGDRDELEAFGIAPGAEVLPVRWSLHRAPVGRPRALRKRALQRAASEYAAILEGLGPRPWAPPGWSLPPEFTPGGDFGPLTPMVAGRVAEFWSADVRTLGNLLEAAVIAHSDDGLIWPATVASALARELGRVEEVARTRDAAVELVERRTQLSNWSDTLIGLSVEICGRSREATLGELEHSFRHHLAELLWAVLATEVVGDRLTSVQRLHGRGVWLTGMGPVGDLPGPQWRAPRRVLDRLLSLLRPLSATNIYEISGRHDDPSRKDYRALADLLQGWAMVSPSGCPHRLLERLPGVVEAKRIVAGKMKAIAPELELPFRCVSLQEWATVMTSAACHRSRLSPSDVAALTAPFLDLLPELPAVING